MGRPGGRFYLPGCFSQQAQGQSRGLLGSTRRKIHGPMVAGGSERMGVETGIGHPEHAWLSKHSSDLLFQNCAILRGDSCALRKC